MSERGGLRSKETRIGLHADDVVRAPCAICRASSLHERPKERDDVRRFFLAKLCSGLVCYMLA